MTTSRLNARDFLLIFAIVLSPIDTIGLGPVGPGEAAIALWLCLCALRKEIRIERHYLCSFWYFLLLFFVIGTVVGSRLTPNETSLTGLFTWAALGAVAIGTLSVAMRRSREELSLILSRAGTLTTVFYLALYALWQSGTSSLGPLPLDFAGVRFTGGASNPHLLAVVIAFALFVHATELLKTRRPALWLYRLMMISLSYLVGSGTGSSTFLLACALTPATWLVIRVVQMQGTKAEKFVALAFITLTGATIATILRDPLLRMADDFISSDENGYGRIEIWRSFDHVLELSPIFGLGPGTHGTGGTTEFHNTFLDIGAIGGLAALVLFTVFVIRLVASSAAAGNLVLLILPYIYYGIAGFSARRLSFWIVIPIIFGFVAVIKRERTARELESTQRTELKPHTRGVAMLDLDQQP